MRSETTTTGIRYSVIGETGPAILLLPDPSTGTRPTWQLQETYLARHFRVVAFEASGAEPVHPIAPDAGVRLADAVAVVDACGADAVVVVGAASGAALPLELAAAHPERVRGAVSIARDQPVRLDQVAPPALFIQGTDHEDASPGR
ncbi:hypothetical protein [Agromyces mangrovi Wang et al. 2018]|uniref:hypothetical protein n=1 Tax=Agromyces mangrovi TaxID=1858653 RepID=UPI0025723837|nr:hypothetical protein [Agromyces mangrovi]BDZ65408.1 hypothetical protein GCM10025877_23460 [Agromyces mangrovi]